MARYDLNALEKRRSETVERLERIPDKPSAPASSSASSSVSFSRRSSASSPSPTASPKTRPTAGADFLQQTKPQTSEPAAVPAKVEPSTLTDGGQDEEQARQLDTWLSDGYRLSREEKADARRLIGENSAAMWELEKSGRQPDARQQEYSRQMQRLANKISPIANVMTGAAEAFGIPALADLMSGGSTGDDAVQDARTQNPIGTLGGQIGGSLAGYALVAPAAAQIPALQQAGTALAGTRGAKALQQIPVLGQAFGAEGIASMLAGQAADLVMDTAPSLARDVRDGKSAGQIAASTMKNLGVNTALNVVGEEIPYLWSAGRQALRGMRSGTQNAAEAAVRTAQNAADALDAAKALPSTAQTAGSAPAGQKSEVDQLVDAFRNGTLTSRQMDTLKPGGVHRAAFEQATGIRLPETSSATRRALSRGIDTNLPERYDKAIESTERAMNDGEAALSGTAGYDRGLHGSLADERRGVGGISGTAEQRSGVPQEVRSSLWGEVAQGARPGQTADHGAAVSDASGLQGLAEGQRAGVPVPQVAEEFRAQARASGMKLGKLKQAEFAYKPVNVEQAGENARQIAEGYTLRGREFVLTDQPLLVNHKGETRQLSDAATSPDGVVYIWKDTSLDPKDVLAHEDFHIAFNRGEKAALEYYDAFISSFDAFDPSYQKAAATINDWYFGGALDLNDLDDLKKVNRELAAYYHQFKENPTLTGLEDFVWVDDFDGMLENSRRTFKESLNLPPDSIGAKKHDPASYAGMQAEYGTIAPGENAARVADVPVSTNGTDRVSAGVRTLMEAPQTPDEMIPLYEKAVADGLFSHDVARDRQVVNEAVQAIQQNGYQKELDAWKSLMNDGSAPSKAGIAKGQVLYTLAAENGDTETAMKLAGDLARIATEAGQNLQAQRLLKRMTPEGKLYYAQQTLESFKKELVDQYGSQFGNISIPGELADALMKAGSQKEQDEALLAIYRNIADQLPATWADRWNAWRYLAMLANPATHIRNVASNVINIPVRRLKNLIGAALEPTFVPAGQRTKSVLNPLDSADRTLKEFARQDLDNVAAILDGSQKYNDRQIIEQLKDPFKVNGSWGTAASSPLPQRIARKAADTAAGAASRLYKANSGALSAEDTLFKKTAYTDSLAQYLKANRIDPKTAEGAVLDKARAYAIEEAKRATYTEANGLAQALGRFEHTNLYTKALVGGIVPFKTTPLNIIKRGLAYSPAGLVKAISVDTALMKAGKMSAAEMIDNLAQGLTGTGIMALGAFLASQGLVNGVAPDNKKQNAFKSAGGWQDYSINLPGGGTYTIDWAGPSVMALLAGVELFHESEQDGINFDQFMTALSHITEPIFDTTMLSGINSAIQSATYAQANPVTAIFGQAARNFVTQSVPTISGQIARALDPVRRTTYSDVGGFTGGLVEDTQRITNRIPGLSEQNPEYVDVWGRTQENPGGSTLGRLAYGMLSPGYYSPDRTTDADRLVEQVYEATGNADVIPSLMSNSLTVNGEKVVLDAQQFTLGKQVKGQTSADMVEALEGYAPFEALEPAGQAAVLEGVYSLANTMAKTQVVPQLEEAFQTAVNSGDLTATEAMMQAYLDGGADAVIPYLVAKEIAGDVTGDKNSAGKTIPGSKKQNTLEALMEAGYSRAQAERIYGVIG